MYARRTEHGGVPTEDDFKNHLLWRPEPTGLLSFTSNFRRAVRRQEFFMETGRTDIVVIAVWAKDLNGVYSAEQVASVLKYPDEMIRNHYDEYLVEGGIAADQFRILAIFEGGGAERDVVFECPFYKISTTIPSGFFPGRISDNALNDIGNEIYRHSGVHDDWKRDELVKSIVGRPCVSLPFLRIRYKQLNGGNREEIEGSI